MNYPVNCKKCGQLIFGPVKFCPFCGAELVVSKPKPEPPSSPKPEPPSSPKPELPTPMPEQPSSPISEQEGDGDAYYEADETCQPGVVEKQVKSKPPALMYAGVAVALIVAVIFFRSIFHDNGLQPAAPVQVNQADKPNQKPADEQRMVQQGIKQQDGLEALHKQQKQQEIVDLINKGMEYYQRGKYQLSIETMNKVLSLDATNQVARNNIEMARRAEQELSDDINAGIAFYNKRQYQLSIEKMKDVLRRDSDNQTARYYIDKAMLGKKMADSAFVHLETGPSR